MIELTVPWEEDMEQFSRWRRTSIVSWQLRAVRSALPYPVEVGCQGFSGTSPLPILSDWHKAKEGQGFLLWLRRKDKKLGNQGSQVQLQGTTRWRPCRCSTTARWSGIDGVKPQRKVAPSLWPCNCNCWSCAAGTNAMPVAHYLCLWKKASCDRQISHIASSTVVGLKWQALFHSNDREQGKEELTGHQTQCDQVFLKKDEFP